MPRLASYDYRTAVTWLRGAVAVMLAGAAPALAETTETQPCVPEVGTVVREAKALAPPPELYATCGDQAVSLGFAERHDVNLNASANALVVTRWNGGIASVQLVFARSDGQLHVDDVSREIARKLGRAEARNLSDVVVNLDGFAEAGTIEIALKPRAAATHASATDEVKDTAPAAGPPAVIDLASYREQALKDLNLRPAATPKTEK